MAQVEWFDDLTIGMRFKSPEVVVTEADIKRFAAEFDPQPMHLDDEAAKQTLFKGLAASGWHTAAIAMNLAIQARPFGPHPLIGAGVDGLRWTMPVRPNDRVHLVGEVMSLTPSRSKPQGVALVKWTMLNQNGEEVHLHADRHRAAAGIGCARHLRIRAIDHGSPRQGQAPHARLEDDDEDSTEIQISRAGERWQR